MNIGINEVWADIDYLIARVEQKTMSREEVVAIVRKKLDATPRDPAPAVGEAEKLRAVLKRLRLRLHFMHWPSEPHWKPHDKWIPDWRYELQLIDNALYGSAITTPEKPSDTVPANQLPPAPPVDAEHLANWITDRLCNADYDIGGREELFEHVLAAIQARRQQGEQS